MSSLPINRLVNVSVNLAPQPAQMQNISNLLILGKSDIIDVIERLRNYTSISAVASDFGTSSPEYLAATLWFEQAPQPTTLSIGRWASSATHGTLIGAVLSAAQQAIALWDIKTVPGFLVYLDGVPFASTPASFAAATNLNAIAALIQTELAAFVVGTTCVWNATYQRFEIKSGTTGILSSVSFVAPSAAVGSAAFSGNPTDLDTLTLNGTTVTFVAGAPAANQVQIGGTLGETMDDLLALLQASADAELVKFTYSLNAAKTAIYFVAATAGVGGNALTLAEVSTVITLSGATLAGATAEDISAMLGMLSTSSGAYVADGIAAETAAEAVAIFDNQFGQAWYGLTICEAVNADHLAVASFIEAATNKHIYGVSTQESGVLVASDTTNIAYQLKQLLRKRTVVQYSSSNAYSANSLLGRILTVDYNGNNTVITLMYKQEPGITAENLTASQLDALESFNCNVFVAYNNNTAIVEKGVVASGEFLDVITGTDWLALDIQTTLYNLLYTTTTKIPQTDSGNHILVTSIEGVCSRGVQNGLLAPGIWDAGGFGALTQGDFLPKGFYVYAPPISSQSVADRAARKSVTIQIAAKLAGAIHTIDAIISVSR